MDSKNTSEKLIEKAKEYFDSNLTKEVTQPVTDRLKNPLFSSFVIAFIVINWDVILYFIFSNDIIEYKIGHFYTHYASIKNQLMKPLFAASLYTTLSPFIMNWVTRIIYYAKSQAIEPSNNYRLLEAKAAKQLQKAISEGTDFALSNIRNQELEKQVELNKIELAKKQSLIEETMSQLQEATRYISEKELEIEKIKTENVERIRQIRKELGNESSNFSTKFIKIFNELYNPDKFNPDLFQDSFTFKKKIKPEFIDGFINFMRDQMKYFGLFTVDIKTKVITDSEIEFTVYFHYPNFKVNEKTKIRLVKMFTEVKI